MNATKIAVLLALFVAVAYSSVCTDQCNGACQLAKQECDAAVLLGPVCGISFGVCSQGCAAICDCVDTCNTQCEPDFTTCKNGATNKIGQIQCNLENDICVVQCQQLCAGQKVGQSVIAAVSQIFPRGS